MRSRLWQVGGLILIATVGRRIYAADPGPAGQSALKEVGINAAISTAFLGGIRSASSMAKSMMH
jgi:hypothetical protein